MKTFRALMAGAWSLVAILAVLSACTSNPVRQAETFEQKAFALYGTYVIFQGKAADLVQDPTVSEQLKQPLRDADRVAFPVAESLADAAATVAEIRDIINKCEGLELPENDPVCTPSNEQRLSNAITNLSAIYFKAQPIVLQLVSTVKRTK